MKRLIAILLSVFLLCACSTSLHDCHVVDKRYEPPRSTVIMMPNGNGGMHLVPMYIPESFSLEIEGRDKTGKVKSKIVEVPEVMYNETEVGDEWEE